MNAPLGNYLNMAVLTNQLLLHVTTQPNILPETNKTEIKRRRYTAYMSDLGK